MSMAWAVLYALNRRSSRAGPDPQPQVEVMLLLEGIQGAVCFQLQPGWLPPRSPGRPARLLPVNRNLKVMGLQFKGMGGGEVKEETFLSEKKIIYIYILLLYRERPRGVCETCTKPCHTDTH